MTADRVTRGWVIVMTSVLGITVSFGSLVIFTFGVFLKPLSGQFGWSRAEVSLAFTLTALMVAVFSPFIGRLVDRVGARKVLLPCVAVYGAAFCCLALVKTLAGLYAIYILLGVVGNGTTQLCYARVISAWFDRRRGLALATMMAGVGAGAIGIPPLATWLIEAYGWRDAYLLLGVSVFVLGMIPAALWLRETPPDVAHENAERANAEKSPATWGMRGAEAARTPVFWLLLTGFFLFSVSVNGSVAHLIPILTDRGIASDTAALAASTLGVLTLCGRLLTGVLLDRFFGSRVAGIFFGIAAVGVAILSQAREIGTAFLGAALIGLGMGAEADVMPYLISRYFGLASFSEIYGYAFTAYALAGALGPLLMGWSFDRFHSYSTVLVVLAAAMLTGAAVLASLPRYSAVAEEQIFAATPTPAA
ncbi:MAG: MFS transporter [Bryobacteraceae bacterium]